MTYYFNFVSGKSLQKSEMRVKKHILLSVVFQPNRQILENCKCLIMPQILILNCYVSRYIVFRFTIQIRIIYKSGIHTI